MKHDLRPRCRFFAQQMIQTNLSPMLHTLGLLLRQPRAQRKGIARKVGQKDSLAVIATSRRIGHEVYSPVKRM